MISANRPISEAYRAALNFASLPEFTHQLVTRSEYAESGSNASRRKFRDWSSEDVESGFTEVGKTGKGKDDHTQSPSRLTRTRSKRR